MHFGINGTAAAVKPGIIEISSCILANIVIDIQPFLVLFAGANIKLHGISHTFLFAALVCAVLFTVYGLVYRTVFNTQKPLYSFTIGGILGAMLHVLIDALIYTDLFPFQPFSMVQLTSSFFIKNIRILCYGGYITFGILILIRFLIKQKRKGENNV